jgi:proline iminopeptidase
VQAGDGVTLWTATDGHGQPLVLCHGGPGMWDYLQPLAGMVSGVAQVHRWDQRGCGRSTIAGPYTVARCIDDLEVLRTAFGHERWIVGGHSWGARLALSYAMAHPGRTTALVLVSGTGAGVEWRAAYHEARRERMSPEQWQRYDTLSASTARTPAEEREHLLLAWSTDYVDPAQSAERVTRMLDEGFPVNYECNREINAETYTWSEDATLAQCRSLDVPVLIVHGADDPRPAWATDTLLEALPRSRRVIIDGAGHLPWVERPGEVRTALRSFLLAQA